MGGRVGETKGVLRGRGSVGREGDSNGKEEHIYVPLLKCTDIVKDAKLRSSQNSARLFCG
jgi:hypothetical protein